MQKWWQDTAIYHAYPRSFLDTNGDGIGDLPGITEKLSYLRDLGIGAIWMGPVFRSPQIDNGYDISDYRDIDPLFGTLQDMDTLIEEASKRGIRVLLDLVFNHTSNQHPWFQSALSNPGGVYNDYYVWREPGEDGGPPNNWQSFFSVPAWTFVPERKQYYLHLFAPEQPDLNWENGTVREVLADTANFWLERGVSGFRLDVINMISKAEGLPSVPERRVGADGERLHPGHGVYINGPRLVEFLQEFRSRLHRNEEIVLVGETPSVDVASARRYTDPANRALDMVLLFDHLALDHGPGGRWERVPWNVADMRNNISVWQDALSDPCWASIYLSNHDQPRIVSRYGDDETFRYESATAIATVFYLQRGSPIIYQGEEIAMANFPIVSADQLVDIESGNAFRALVAEGIAPQEALRRVSANARDNSRTPMQWSPDTNAAFTAGDVEPWYPVNPDYKTWNVQDQSSGHDRSVLAYYRELLKLRRDAEVVRSGSLEMVADSAASPVLSYRRAIDDHEAFVAANLSGETVTWTPSEHYKNQVPDLTNYPRGRHAIDRLQPWECRVYQI